VSTFKYPPSLAQIVKRVIDHRLMGNHFFWPVLAYYSESETDGLLCQRNSDVKEHVLHLSFASRKTMVVKRTDWFYVKGRGTAPHHAQRRHKKRTKTPTTFLSR
jgi:hypothetical protein